MKFWERINRYLLWLTLFVLPWQTRDVLFPVYRQGDFVEYASRSIYLTDLLIIALLVSWLPLLIRKQKLVFGPRIVSGPLLALVVWMWLSSLWAYYLGSEVIISIWAAAHFTLFFLFYLHLINNARTIRDVLLPLGWGIAWQGIMAIAQYFYNHSLGWRLLGESVLDPLVSGIPVVLVDGVRQLRAHGTLPHANVLGGYLAVGLIMISPWLYAVRRRFIHWLVWAMLVIGLGGLLLSFSRAAWLVLAVSVVIISVWAALMRPRKFRASLTPWLLVIIVVALLASSQFSVVASRFDFNQPIEQISLSSRWRQVQDFKSVYLNHPIMGVGLGQYVPYLIGQDESSLGWSYQEKVGGWVYNPGRSGRYYEPVHNIFMLILAELGAIGLLLFGLIVVGAVYLIWRLIWKRRALIGVATLLAVVSVLSLGMVDHYLWTLQQGRLILFLVMGLVAILFIHSGYNRKHGGAES